MISVTSVKIKHPDLEVWLPRSMSKTGFFPILVDTKEKRYENGKCDIPNDVLKIVMTRFLQMIGVKTIASKGHSRLGI